MSLLLGISAFVFSCCCLVGALITLLPEIASNGKKKSAGWWVWMSGATLGLIFFYITAVASSSLESSRLIPLPGVNRSESISSSDDKNAIAEEKGAAQPSVNTVKASEEVKFIGGINGNMYHIPGCYLVQRMAPDNQRYFYTRVQAEVAGYKACPECRP